jgi:plastocyanin
MTGSDDSGAEELDTYRLARRAVLKATGGVAALSLGAGTAAAANHGNAHSGNGNGPSGNDNGPGTGDGNANPNYIDPVFGKASAEPKPDSFRPPVRPDHEVDMLFTVENLLFAAASAAETELDESQVVAVNSAAADGTVTKQEAGNLNETITIETPDGSKEVPLSAVAGALTETLGFNFEPAGLMVEPGDVVAFDAVSPDHLVASYHERHGRQNRVPGDPGSGTGLISSPLIPVGGYWLYQFEEPGVYDLNCTVHELFGMVMRVVVTDDPNDVPELDVDEGSGRPPEDVNEISLVFDGLDPNLPSSAEALDTEALSPENIVAEGEVSWEAVVEEHRTS